MNGAKGAGRPDLGRWLRTGFRFMLTGVCLLVLGALNRCGTSSQPTEVSAPNTPTVEAPTITPEPRDSVPTVTLVAVPPSPTAATPEPMPLLPDLVVKHAKIDLETGGGCDYSTPQLGVRLVVENVGDADSPPFVVQVNDSQQTLATGLAAGQTESLWFEGYVQSGENIAYVDAMLQIEESDEANNSLSQMLPIPTLPPACTPPPVVAPTEAPAPTPPRIQPVTVRGGSVTISTYPYAQFLSEARNDAYNMTYAVLDRAAYEGSNPAPKDMGYRTFVIENDYLRLTFLPDVGGRLYEVLYKPTGNTETYRNPVLKPSPWGPPEQGWWLAAGGIEWCLPVEEHGYEWGMPWMAQAVKDGSDAKVTLRDTFATDRVRAEILVRLQAGAGFFTIRPRIENPTGKAQEVKYWTNAMLAPGPQNAPSADLRFVLPDAVSEVTIHSRGDDKLPGSDERMSWPVYDGVDLSRLGNWTQWLGFFEDPAADGFVAVYDEGYDEGMVRVFPAEVARGVKGFGLGWSEPIAAHNWTDDGSSYVELHGGLAPTFGDSVVLPAGGHLQWTETWYPVAGLGGLRYANRAAALNLTAGGGVAEVAIATPRAWSGEVILLLDGQEHWRAGVSLVPGEPFRSTVPLGDGAPETGELAVRLEASDGSLSAEYASDFRLK